MAFFPKIQSPCPYKNELAAVMDGDFCRMCKRQVFDLSDWSDDERVAFLGTCNDEICVSYRLPLRPALAAIALAAAALPAAAAAQEPAPPIPSDVGGEVHAEDLRIFVGGIRDPRNIDYIDDADAASVPELPIVHEDAPAPAGSTK